MKGQWRRNGAMAVQWCIGDESRSTHRLFACRTPNWRRGTFLLDDLPQWSPSSCNYTHSFHPGTIGQSNVCSVLRTSGWRLSHTQGLGKAPSHHTLYNNASFSHGGNVCPHHTLYNRFFVCRVYSIFYCYTFDSRILFSHARTCTCTSSPYCLDTVAVSTQEFP